MSGDQEREPVGIAAARRDLLRVACAGVVALVIATWTLWSGTSVIPQVPVAAGLRVVPIWVDWGLVACVGAALGAAMLFAAQPSLASPLSLSAVAGLTALCALNQHRFQPWVYQFGLLAGLLATRRAAGIVIGMRVLFVGIYGFSALSKFDYSFLHSTGKVFVATADRWIPGTFGNESLPRWAVLLPVGELLVGIGMLLPLCLSRRSEIQRRPWATASVVAAVALHLFLLALLGPWGLNHRAGVLIWNCVCIAQLVCLGRLEQRCGQAASGQIPGSASPGGRIRKTLGWLPLLVATVMPALEPWEYWDAWPAWGLYSTRASRAELYLPADAKQDLPVELRPFVRYRESDPFWIHLRLDVASLELLDTPLYPASRFQLGCIRGVLERMPRMWHEAARVEIGGVADRRTGNRTWQSLTGDAAIRRHRHAYWLNIQPRR